MVSRDFSTDTNVWSHQFTAARGTTETGHAQTLQRRSLWTQPTSVENIWGKIVPIMTHTNVCLSSQNDTAYCLS